MTGRKICSHEHHSKLGRYLSSWPVHRYCRGPDLLSGHPWLVEPDHEFGLDICCLHVFCISSKYNVIPPEVFIGASYYILQEFFWLCFIICYILPCWLIKGGSEMQENIEDEKKEHTLALICLDILKLVPYHLTKMPCFFFNFITISPSHLPQLRMFPKQHGYTISFKISLSQNVILHLVHSVGIQTRSIHCILLFYLSSSFIHIGSLSPHSLIPPYALYWLKGLDCLFCRTFHFLNLTDCFLLVSYNLLFYFFYFPINRQLGLG